MKVEKDEQTVLKIRQSFSMWIWYMVSAHSATFLRHIPVELAIAVACMC